MTGRPRRDDHPEPRRQPRGQLQLEESRRSFHRQVEQLKDIDDKAMRSVRTAVVVVGFVVTAVGVVFRLGTVDLGPGSALFTGVGVLSLVATVVAGVGTATVTEYRTRLTDAERARLEHTARERSTPTAELVRMYHGWLDVTEEELAQSATFLGATLASLGLGVVSLSIATALAILESAHVFAIFPPMQTLLLELFAVGSVLTVLGWGTKLTAQSVSGYL